MAKLDLKKEQSSLYRPPAKEVTWIDVPELSFLMIDGAGNPNTSASFQEAIGALYNLSYTLKFSLKRQDPAADFGIMPLEGLWWTDDSGRFDPDSTEEWRWTLMIQVPAFISAAAVDAARAEIKRKKAVEAVERVRFERFCEGRCAQIMHIGPYAAERPTIERLQAFIAAGGCTAAGKHHEIYLSDPRRAAPDKMRTILRQPARCSV